MTTSLMGDPPRKMGTVGSLEAQFNFNDGVTNGREIECR